MNKLIVSSSPHIRSARTTRGIMLDVIIALMPAVVAGTVIFGLRALLVALACVASAVISELLFNLILQKWRSSLTGYAFILFLLHIKIV